MVLGGARLLERGKNKENHRSIQGDRMHIREHLSNERTFLSWIRTAITIMGLGFILEKFSFYLSPSKKGIELSPAHFLSNYLGAALNVLAGIVIILAVIRFQQTRRQIDEGQYITSITLDFILASIVILVAVLATFLLTMFP